MTTTMIIAVSVFTYFSTLGLILSLVWTFKIDTAYKMLNMAAGYNLHEAAAADELSGKAMKFLLIDFTSQMIGVNLFALHVIWFAFRHGQMWAWCIMWYYPVMFAWHYLHYAKGTGFSKVQIVYFVLSAGTLILAYSNFN